MPAPFRVLVNRSAGSAAEDGLLDEIVAAFAAAGAEATAEHVTPDDLPAAMRAVAGRGEQVVVAGGDGTINAAAAVAVEDGLTLGVLPRGTFNHFAKDFGIPVELDEAAAFLAAATPVAVDVGEVNDRIFVNNASIGVYPRLVARRDELRRERGWGKIRAGALASWWMLCNPPRLRLRLALAGQDPAERGTSLLFVGNGLYDDGGDVVGARTSLTDGVLGVYLIEATTRGRLVGQAIRARFGGLGKADRTHRWSVPELIVDVDSPVLSIALDGEAMRLSPPLRMRSRPGALRILGRPGADAS